MAEDTFFKKERKGCKCKKSTVNLTKFTNYYINRIGRFPNLELCKFYPSLNQFIAKQFGARGFTLLV